MVVGKWIQIRASDKVIVFMFEEDGKEIGSRGINVSDEEFELLKSLDFGTMMDAKLKGIEVPDSLDEGDDVDILTQLVYRAYREYLQAKKIEDERQSGIIEM